MRRPNRLLPLILPMALLWPGAVGSASGRTPAVLAEPVTPPLEFPAAFTLAPDGRIFYGERLTGEVRIFDPSSGTDTLFYTVEDLSTDGEQGLIGLTLHFQYPAKPYVYVFATRVVDGAERDQLIMLTDVGGGGVNPRYIFTGDSADNNPHHGGRVSFGPDGRLYLSRGDALNSANAQDLTNTDGKILRMTSQGLFANNNPFPGSLIWAYGIRNSFGFAFDPLSKFLWLTDNGATCNDEANRIVKGSNYGWGPTAKCTSPPPPPMNSNRDGPNPVLPLAFYSPPIAPTGLTFCVQCGIAASDGHLFFGAYNTGEIREVVLTADRKGVQDQFVAYSHPSGILAMERGPDGTVYFSDVSGIWRLVPA